MYAFPVTKKPQPNTMVLTTNIKQVICVVIKYM